MPDEKIFSHASCALKSYLRSLNRVMALENTRYSMFSGRLGLTPVGLKVSMSQT